MSVNSTIFCSKCKKETRHEYKYGNPGTGTKPCWVCSGCRALLPEKRTLATELIELIAGLPEDSIRTFSVDKHGEGGDPGLRKEPQRVVVTFEYLVY